MTEYDRWTKLTEVNNDMMHGGTAVGTG